MYKILTSVLIILIAGLITYYLISREQRHEVDDRIAQYEARAQAGDSDAWLQLGGMYLAGENIDINQSKAFEHYSKAAQAGNPMAQSILGRLYLTGKGTRPSTTQASYWYQMFLQNQNILQEAPTQ